MARILFINDEPDLLMLYQIALEQAGHVVETHVGGTHAMESVRRFRPELIGVDWIMPDTSGEEILHHLKTEPDTRSIPVIVISALQGLDSHARLLGADEVMRKPFRVRDLLAAIDRLLSAAQARGETSSAERH